LAWHFSGFSRADSCRIAERDRRNNISTFEFADDHPELFAPFLGRLLPLQINAKTERSVKVTYSTVEEVRAALIARGLAPERADLLLIGKVPEPVEVLGDVEKESF
jgi:hypothetical protein